MKKRATSETITGVLKQLLFSPKGTVEGLLLTFDGNTIQISTAPGALDAAALQRVLGKPVRLKGTADHSPKTKHGAHPVYALDKLLSLAGKPAKSTVLSYGSGPLKGVVAQFHYARHGEPNGVILKSGEFIHLRPHGMKATGLQVGSKIVVHGERRLTALGTPLIEAHQINRQKIE